MFVFSPNVLCIDVFIPSAFDERFSSSNHVLLPSIIPLISFVDYRLLIIFDKTYVSRNS